MNFVISHRQTSQSDSNPVILLRNHYTPNCCRLLHNSRTVQNTAAFTNSDGEQKISPGKSKTNLRRAVIRTLKLICWKSSDGVSHWYINSFSREIFYYFILLFKRHRIKYMSFFIIKLCAYVIHKLRKFSLPQMHVFVNIQI